MMYCDLFIIQYVFPLKLISDISFDGQELPCIIHVTNPNKKTKLKTCIGLKGKSIQILLYISIVNIFKSDVH